MYGNFFTCKHCHKKGAYVVMYYVGHVPPYAFVRCRYCNQSWETHIDHVKKAAAHTGQTATTAHAK